MVLVFESYLGTPPNTARRQQMSPRSKIESGNEFPHSKLKCGDDLTF